MNVHVGFPIAPHTAMHEQVEFAVKPGGTYVIAIHRKPHESLHKTTAMRLGWAKEHAVKWHSHEQTGQGSMDWTVHALPYRASL